VRQEAFRKKGNQHFRSVDKKCINSRNRLDFLFIPFLALLAREAGA
jgi:hypothetical protein